MPSPAVEAFLFDDDNEEKLAAHGLSARQVFQVLENESIILVNRKGRRAPYLMIGLDKGGSCIAIPIEPTYDPTVWRPVTAWRCKDAERAKLQGR